MKSNLLDCKGGGAYRLGFIVLMLFLGYKMVILCSRNVFLQDYMANLQPVQVVPTSTASQAAKEGGGSDVKKSRRDTWPLLYPSVPNESESLLQQAAENRTRPCYQQATFTAKVYGLPQPERGKPIQLETGKIHDLLIVSYEANGRRRCAGGDFFETDLNGPNWKARPPILDHHDGSYGVQLMVDSSFPGIFVFKIVLLFANFHALDAPEASPWSRLENILTVEIEFRAPVKEEFSLRRCGDGDWSLKAWSGRWNRKTWNETCEIRDDGRFICIDPEEPCAPEWCEGKVGMLESNGWTYSAHCKFKIFTTDEAWQCLNGRWLFFWGDSNNEDTVRNLLNFVLGFPLPDVNHMRRWFNGTFSRPGNETQSVTITKIFNGHFQEQGNLAGLSSLRIKSYRELLTSFWNGKRFPDTMVMNSGLHDAHRYRTARDFAKGVDYAVRFWNSLWRGKKPAVVYRTTITSAGLARDGLSNPHKMEIYNRIFVEKLQKQGRIRPSLKVVDAFDMTFPWHYDLNHTDGVHYGRAPSKTPWPSKNASNSTQIGHQYFVDLMLVHILLNAVVEIHGERNPFTSEYEGEEMLELKGNFNWRAQHLQNIFAFLPNSTYDSTSIGCKEFLGNMFSFLHVGQSPILAPEMTWRIGIRKKLELMGQELVVTLVGEAPLGRIPGEDGFVLTSARIVYSNK